jgi:hypothetical protein
MSGQKRWTIGNARAEHDERFETFAKSRSRFKNERTTALFVEMIIIDNQIFYTKIFKNFCVKIL